MQYKVNPVLVTSDTLQEKADGVYEDTVVVTKGASDNGEELSTYSFMSSKLISLLYDVSGDKFSNVVDPYIITQSPNVITPCPLLIPEPLKSPIVLYPLSKWSAIKVLLFGDNKYENLDQMLNIIENETNKDGKKFIYAYDDEPDGTMHDFGFNSTEVKKLIIERNNKVEKLINETPLISEVQRAFYKHMLNARYNKILLASLEKLDLRG